MWAFSLQSPEIAVQEIIYFYFQTSLRWNFSENMSKINLTYTHKLFSLLQFHITGWHFVISCTVQYQLVLRIRTIFFTVSGPEFRQRQDPDPIQNPDPDLNKFSANYFVEIFLMKLCSKKNINRSKSLTTEIPVVFVYTPKKLR
jgi:hypothetical protein